MWSSKNLQSSLFWSNDYQLYLDPTSIMCHVLQYVTTFIVRTFLQMPTMGWRQFLAGIPDCSQRKQSYAAANLSAPAGLPTIEKKCASRPARSGPFIFPPTKKTPKDSKINPNINYSV